MECRNENIKEIEKTEFTGSPGKAEEMPESTEATVEATEETKQPELPEDKTEPEKAVDAEETKQPELPEDKAEPENAVAAETEETKQPELSEEKPEEAEEKAEKAEEKPELQEEKSQEKKTSPRRGKRIIAISIASVVLVLVGIYIGFSIYFMNHFYLGTRIDGSDCSCMTPAAVETELQNQLLTYRLLIGGRNGLEDTITASDVAMTYGFNNELEEIMNGQNGFLWFTALFDRSEYHLQKELQIDEDKLEKAVEELQVFNISNIKEPQNAYISDYLPEEKGYTIIQEREGAWPSKEAPDKIKAAIAGLQPEINLEDDNLYDEPSVTEDDRQLQSKAAALNHYTNTVITYQFGDEKEILDGDTIHEWLSIRGSHVQLDDAAVADYVKTLAAKHDTYYNKRTITTTAGERKELRSCYGWMIDQEAETAMLLEELENGESITREPVYKYQGEVHSDTDIGDSYVEIDIGSQHLYLYIEGTLILETDFVSGNMSEGNGTPSGVYNLDYRTRDVVLKGPTWESFVNYWMPFNGSVGMHDATWRKEFGGDIYLTAGSHGCINLPYGMAKEIYSYVYAGIPVICYY